MCVCTWGLAYLLAFLQLALSLLFLSLSLLPPTDLPDTQEVTYRKLSDARGKGGMSTAGGNWGLGGAFGWVMIDTHSLLSSVLPLALRRVRLLRHRRTLCSPRRSQKGVVLLFTHSSHGLHTGKELLALLPEGELLRDCRVG